MCGILFCSSKDGYKVNKATAKRFQKQKNRGTRGFGYLTINDGKIGKIVRAKYEADILRELKREQSQSILFHHRMPTAASGANYEEMTHPFHISDSRHKFDYYVVHNGVIGNDGELHKEYAKDNYIFMSEMQECKTINFPNQSKNTYETDFKFHVNDSEVLAADLSRYFEGLQKTIRSRGTISFICIKTEKDGTVVEVIWGHNSGNPLKVEEDKTMFCLRSEGKDCDEVEVDTINRMDWKTGARSVEKAEVGSFYGRKTTGYDSSKTYGRRSEDSEPTGELGDADSWGASEEERKSHTRMLSPTAPLLPERVASRPFSPMSMGGSLREIGAALARQAAKEQGNGRDDERDYGQHEEEGVIEYGGPEDDDTPDSSMFDIGVFGLTPDNVSYKKLRDLLGDLSIDEMGDAGNYGQVSDEVRDLRKQLREAIAQTIVKEGDYREVVRLLDKEIKEGKPDDVLATTREFIIAARFDLKGCIGEINNINAELTAWIGN